MTFKIGDRVRQKERGTYLRLSFPGTETGTVISVREYPDEDVRIQLDIKLDNGEVVRTLADHRFELVQDRASPPPRAG
jgi:hypothetical protein